VIRGSIFAWAPAAARRLCRDRRVDDGLGADVLRHKVGMLAKPITRPLDLDDDGVVKQAIEERGGDHWVAEDLTPFGKAAIGGKDHGGALVARIDSLEE
jgi:hypothetical protein